MEKIHGNTHVFVLSCKFLTCKHKNMRVSMYFLHLELTFTPTFAKFDLLVTVVVLLQGKKKRGLRIDDSEPFDDVLARSGQN